MLRIQPHLRMLQRVVDDRELSRGDEILNLVPELVIGSVVNANKVLNPFFQIVISPIPADTHSIVRLSTGL